MDTNEHITILNEKFNALKTEMSDLLEYLRRTKVISGPTGETPYANWHDDLTTMRYEEEQQQKIHRAKQFLRNAGYLVAESDIAMDAEKVRNWVEHKNKNAAPK